MAKKKKVEEKYSPKFELVLQVRSHTGEPTGKTLSYNTDDAYKLDEFYQRNVFRDKSKLVETTEKTKKKATVKKTKIIKKSN